MRSSIWTMMTSQCDELLSARDRLFSSPLFARIIHNYFRWRLVWTYLTDLSFNYVHSHRVFFDAYYGYPLHSTNEAYCTREIIRRFPLAIQRLYTINSITQSSAIQTVSRSICAEDTDVDALGSNNRRFAERWLSPVHWRPSHVDGRWSNEEHCPGKDSSALRSDRLRQYHLDRCHVGCLLCESKFNVSLSGFENDATLVHCHWLITFAKCRHVSPSLPLDTLEFLEWSQRSGTLGSIRNTHQPIVRLHRCIQSTVRRCQQSARAIGPSQLAFVHLHYIPVRWICLSVLGRWIWDPSVCYSLRSFSPASICPKVAHTWPMGHGWRIGGQHRQQTGTIPVVIVSRTTTFASWKQWTILSMGCPLEFNWLANRFPRPLFDTSVHFACRTMRWRKWIRPNHFECREQISIVNSRFFLLMRKHNAFNDKDWHSWYAHSSAPMMNAQHWILHWFICPSSCKHFNVKQEREHVFDQ